MSERPVFGIPLFGQTVEPGSAPEVPTIGCSVRVDDFGVTDSYMGIEASAEQRFVVTRWLEPAPYPVAEIEYLPELVWDNRFESERILIELEVRDLLSRVEHHGELLRGSSTPVAEDPVAGLWQLASFLPIQPEQLVGLLASETVPELIGGIRELCAGGHAFLDELDRDGS